VLRGWRGGCKQRAHVLLGAASYEDVIVRTSAVLSPSSSLSSDSSLGMSSSSTSIVSSDHLVPRLRFSCPFNPLEPVDSLCNPDCTPDNPCPPLYCLSSECPFGRGTLLVFSVISPPSLASRSSTFLLFSSFLFQYPLSNTSPTSPLCG
jgi:hypothetical protein